eukprot:12909544-Prorocentrum_lima.AAC.1
MGLEHFRALRTSRPSPCRSIARDGKDVHVISPCASDCTQRQSVHLRIAPLLSRWDIRRDSY